MVPTVFQWCGGGKLVYVGGTFSEWKALPMVESHGSFVTIVNIPEGDHQYKFLVDGEWMHDPKLKCVVRDKGITNNLATVRQTEFRVFQALVNDSEDTCKVESKERGQDIPTATPWDEDQLLQDPLNQDTLLSCEPTLLPRPNNVMLNHLYVTSIENGVTVLSTNHRYRKKHLTTEFYKPI
ncbi:5'-AMP-activated protein kinase subunit beta-1-like [Anopheles ziemanni]|uniref:5'-AMP-activated protein kinase subunit beta-1-like n=1 Tax=Anopheles coustani TaxID=139045 RepID=UPI0026584538|nr:5'-AMP-activated protein kinase subunit beta-1-like [Anopheles coustani]XP_058176024.1 5'-AMP-activated protein kinase subunit beta-1-like [Anopheles ziemanni]